MSSLNSYPHIPFTHQVSVDQLRFAANMHKSSICMVFCGFTFRELGNLNVHVSLLSEIPLFNHTPFLLPGADGQRTVTIEELKERAKVTDIII